MKQREVSVQCGAARVAAAASITILDGFDAFSLSLMAPMFTRDLDIAAAWLGPIFASSMGGMIVGAFAGGALADRLGRLRILMVALALFGVAALTMPLMESAQQIIMNRLIAGVGLGAAAPIAVALLNRGSATPPSAFAVSLVWVGIAVGGTLAALFNYVFAAVYGWQLIFIVGGLIPIPVAIFAFAVFRSARPEAVAVGQVGHPRILDLFARDQLWLTITVAAMFFLGFITTSIIVYWLPTILAHRAASPLTISISFAGINIGAIVATIVFGLAAQRGSPGVARTAAWGVAAISGFAATLVTLDNSLLAIIATAAAMVGAGGQALSVSLANEIHRSRGLQSTSVGFMAASGRLGQFSALGASSALVAASGRETIVFALAGLTAGLAAMLSAFVAYKQRRR